ncbi:Phage tail fibers [Escherichia phage Gluttony_ev152]|uniref:Phage tail fibers n=1 Tax=Escherichia phage Gluttony_ev152 TaxID=2742948 RepID=A0A653FVX2_9CAUD|nr:Phage tail fibers [Escherichia phage Gluttony_ev152]VUF54124.1 Phage tail fibers [Escherichia phage Gluttony_ev152]
MAAGTLSVTNNSKAVVGVGTTFTAFKAGDFLTLVVGQVPYTVAIASIESATALTLVLPFDGPTATGLAWDGVKRDTMSLATMGVTVQAQKALRLMIADENNWRAIFGEEEEISVTLPNGQVVQGMSWGYLSKLLKDVDPVELQAIADQTITAKNQAQGFRNEAEGFKNTANTAKDAAVAAKTAAETAKSQAVTAKAKTAAETAKSQAVTAKDQAKGFRDEAEGFANSADASKKVPYAGVTLPAPTGVRDMLKRLRDSVKGGFWRVDDIAQFPSGEMTPFRYGPGVCGGAGDTFFAINVDWQTSRVKVFSGNNNAINGASGSVSAIELAKLGANGDVAIGDGGTGASNDQGARKNLQAMHERQASLDTEDLNVLQGDKAGFYYQSLSANATPERNYPINQAGCLLVQRSGANDPKSCIQTYTSYLNGRRWIRWLSNATTGTWSQWYELYNAGSSPTFSGVITGSAVRASVDGKIITIKPGVNDVVIHNSASNKFLQLKDDGGLSYDNKLIAYNGLAASGTFAMTVPSIKVTTANGGFRIDGTTSTNNQPLHVTGYNSAGTRLWFLGKDTGTNALFLNDVTSSKVELITDGVVLGTKNFAGKAYVQAASLEIDRPSGKYFKMQNDGTSSHPATFKLWGNGSERASVIECGFDNGPGWVFYAQYNSNGTRQMNVNGTVNCTTVNQSSDRELKDNIKPIENARAGLAKMGGYTYTLKKDGMPYAGVIAQEVMDVVPEAVSTFEDYEHLAGPTQDGEELVGRQRFFQVDYGAIAAYAVQVCKEQEEELVSLRSELEELKAAVAALTKA